MNDITPSHSLEFRSEITNDAKLVLSLVKSPVQPPAENEVLVRMEAAPINPSDMALILGPVSLSSLRTEGSTIVADIPTTRMPDVHARVGHAMPVGNEGCGTIIKAGQGAEGLIGKRVAILGGGMYTLYRTVNAASCLILPDDATPWEGASAYINPLTALCMMETMKREGHKAIVHTAAASNLGQMLNRVCLKDNIGIINIVRKPEQVELLKDIGARYVLDSTSFNFIDDLTDAVAETGATLAFDAVGGGELAGDILYCMESAINRNSSEYSRYGSQTIKQVYCYGNMDWGPTVIHRRFGMAWSVGGWLLTWRMQGYGAEFSRAIKKRVANELRTTFASHYTGEIGLYDLLRPEVLLRVNRFETGSKYLINPMLGRP